MAWYNCFVGIAVSHLRTPALRALVAAGLLAVPAGAAAGDYTSSAHGSSTYGVDRSAVDPAYSAFARGNCSHCHEQHASLGGAEPLPADGGPSKYLLFTAETDNAFCATCHADIATETTKAYAHSPSSAPGPVLCVDCHDPHRAQRIPTRNPAAEDNNATGAVVGAAGVEPDGFSLPGTPSPGQETLASATGYTARDPISKEYQLCLKCHSTYNGGPVAGGDVAAHFNPGNYAHHPVLSDWQNPNILANYTVNLKPPWNSAPNAHLKCTDCHGNPAGTPRGPHGSNTRYMLRAWGARTNPNAAECYDNLCLLCHVDTYDGGTAPGSPWSHGSNAAHQYEGDGAGQNSLGCRACHGGPPGRADYTALACPPPVAEQDNGGRTAAVHGEHFMWSNPGSGKQTCTGYTSNPADHLLLGGYLLGIRLDNYHGGADGDGTCWAASAGVDACGSMNGGKPW